MLVLASASPRRAQILTELGIAFEIDAADVDESLRDGEAPDSAVGRLAAAKAAVVAARRPSDWVLAADTLVFLEGAILGKPRDDRDAADMLRRLSGREHRVVTGVRLRRGPHDGSGSISWSTVHFAPMSADEIAWYVGTGEPRDKAGAYGIQGRGARFIEGIDGSYTNVMGLPARDVYRLMKEAESLRAAGTPGPSFP